MAYHHCFRLIVFEPLLKGEITMKRYLRITGLIALIIVLSGMVLCSSPAQGQCSASTIVGSYVYSYTGLIGTNNGLTNVNSFRPTATAGRIVFDEDGGLAGSQTDNSTATVFQITYTGSYTLDTSTCSGTLTRTFVNGFQVKEDFFLTNDGKEIRFVRTSPSLFIVAGTLTRQ
jgi:hypothetical protein